MRLLFDENLSHRLVQSLSDVFPGSEHVRNVGLSSADDFDVARYAAVNNLVIVTKDSDFEEIGLVGSQSVQVIRLNIGNSTTNEVELVLRSVAAEVEEALLANPRVIVTRTPSP